MPRGALLDIDGTLLLSNRAHAEAWTDALREFNFNLPADLIEPLIGMGGDKLLATLVPGLSDKDGIGVEIAGRRQEIFLSAYAPDLQPAPGARELVERLRTEGLKLVVATSAKGDELRVLLRHAGIDDLIEEATTSDQVDQSKPEPDVVQAALKRGGLKSEEAILIGDTPYDVEAGKRAGVQVVAVRCGGHNVDLQGAVALYDNPADILKQFERTVFVQSNEGG